MAREPCPAYARSPLRDNKNGAFLELCSGCAVACCLAAAAPLLAAGAPALGIISELDGDANRPISRCAHDAPHSRTHPEGSMLGPGAAARKAGTLMGAGRGQLRYASWRLWRVE